MRAIFGDGQEYSPQQNQNCVRKEERDEGEYCVFSSPHIPFQLPYIF